MTKYLLNLVCIVAIAGAAHGASVADLHLTPDGHAYLVFAGTEQLAGYSVEDSGVTFLTGGTIPDGTGEFGDGWVSLDTQHVFAGEDYGTIPGPGTDPDGWFAQATGTAPLPNTLIADLNVDGFLGRPTGAPVYIGQILDPTAMGLGTPFSADDLAGGGGENGGAGTERLANITFKSIDNDNNLQTGTVGIFGRTALAPAVHTDLDNADTKAYQNTGGVGVAGTHLDITSVVGVAPNEIARVLDLECTGTAGVYGHEYTGHVMIDGTLTAVSYADLTPTRLRVSAVDGGTTISIDIQLTESGNDGFGRWGTIDDATDEMVVSLVRGDFNADGNANAVDLDAVNQAAFAGGEDKLLYDLDGDHDDVDRDDADEMVFNLVETDIGNGTLYGDANLDGATDIGDYGTWATTYLTFAPAVATGGWLDGDFNGDGIVDIGDYGTWATTYLILNPLSPPAAPIPTPEPATMTLLAIGALGLVRRRRRS